MAIGNLEDLGLWLDFDVGDGVEVGKAAGVELTSISPGAVAGRVSLPGVWLEPVTLGDMPFTQLSVPGYGTTTAIGEPQLPIVRSLLTVPEGVKVTAEISGRPQLLSMVEVGVEDRLLPVQAPVVKLPGAREAATLQYSQAAYQSDEFGPQAGIQVVEAGYLSGRRLVMIEIAPIAYNPVAEAISVYDTLTFHVRFEGGHSTEPVLSAVEDARLADLAINHSADTGAKVGGRLLIVAHDDFVAEMAPFVAHKTSLGWTVDLVDTSTAGSTNVEIRAYIRSRYDNLPTRPDAVLLVGDTDRIPHFVGSGTERPATDLYYGTMDDGDDWYPEIPVGRFSVADRGQLAGVIEKTISYETGSGAWTTQVALMAGRDNFQITEGTHNFVVEEHLDRLGYTSDKLYRTTYGASTQDVRDAFNTGRMMGIYSGHGSDYSWIDGPPFTQADVRNLIDTEIYPLIASFACVTGRYSLDESFMETWLRVPGRGAVVAVGSSVNSYWTEDDILEKVLFDAIFDEGYAAFGSAWVRAKELYLQHFGVSPRTRAYFEMYNVMGDPTVEVLGLQLGNDGHLTVRLPAKVWEGQGTLSGAGSVALDGPLPADLDVSLASDDVTELTVPTVVTLPAGQTSVPFDLFVQDDTDYDGSQPVRVSAAAPGLSAAAAAEVGDNDLHHFAVGRIADPQTVGVPFEVTLWAKDVDDETIEVYRGAADLFGVGEGGAVPIEINPTGQRNDEARITNDEKAPSPLVIRASDSALGVYHNYAQLTADLQQYAAAYPAITRLESIGRSVQGRELWALKITDNPDVEEDEPEFKYVSTMHGNEPVGTEMSLYFINELLANYGRDPRITALIEETEIWLLPLLNPDGREAATRYNARGVDLNRNFPEGAYTPIGNILAGPPMDLIGRQPETVHLMQWSAGHSFTLSANFHTGAVVVNYPYDNDALGSVFSPTPDQELFEYVSETYAVHNPSMWNSPTFYHGITNGAAWYSISGGMQDWNYRYLGDHDVTVELSQSKWPPESTLPGIWAENRESLLSYLEAVHMGARGLLTDAITGLPVFGAVTVEGNEHPIFSDPDVGDYHRMLLPGTYELTFSAPGYASLSISDVEVVEGAVTSLDVALVPLGAAVVFSEGQWTGEVAVHAVDTNVVLSVDDGSGHVADSNSFNVVPPVESTVVARHIFYNNSFFDGDRPSGGPGTSPPDGLEADPRDDLAIATDKVALMPGETATFANYTSYDQGINGIMVDIAGLPEASLSPGDFRFKVGNDDAPAAWEELATAPSITVRQGGGVADSDRVTLTWPAGAISNQWLQVTVLAGSSTGLAEDDVFYFGNAVGESGNSITDAKVNVYDVLGVRDNPRSFLNPAPIDFDFDYNRDARVNVYDMLIARDNTTHFLNALKLITLPPMPPRAGTATGGIRVASVRDAVLEIATRGESSRHRMAWVYDFEPIRAPQRPSPKGAPAAEGVDLLLATSRQ